METEERIKKARIKLQIRNPFFSYLSLFLKFQEVKKGEMMCDTMGIDLQGNVYYVKEFVDKLSDEELIGTIAHEICHLVFLTELREMGRNREGWNFASDMAINTLLKNNDFDLIKGCVLPNMYNYEFNFGNNKVIKDVNEKNAEQIYDEIPKIQETQTQYIIGGGGVGNEFNKNDSHIKSKKLTPSEEKQVQKEWNDRVMEAYTNAKMCGKLPNGVERLVGKLHEEKINWKSLLNTFITQMIPYNYTYSKPHKKSISIGEYMPDILKEKIEIDVMVDLSGSVGEQEYADFISEIIGIAKAYQERLEMKIFSHDTECYDNGYIRNGNIDKIKKMKLKGCGGTSHKKVFEYLKENVKNCKAVIFFTDGFSDLNEIDMNKYPFQKLFIISKNGDDTQINKSQAVVIKLEEFK